VRLRVKARVRVSFMLRVAVFTVRAWVKAKARVSVRVVLGLGLY
jgi:hypothetical protein